MGTKTKQREAWKAQRPVQQPRITAVTNDELKQRIDCQRKYSDCWIHAGLTTF